MNDGTRHATAASRRLHPLVPPGAGAVALRERDGGQPGIGLEQP